MHMPETGSEGKVTKELETAKAPYCWAVRTYKHLNVSYTVSD